MHIINGLEYNRNSIDFIQTEEGRAVRDNTGRYKYEYNLTDHLGNVRYSFDIYENNVVKRLQSDDYYAFGMRKPGTPVAGNNRCLYNGKEIQEELLGQYDYGARFYDPVIGRFNTIDPLSEISRRNSPYNYALNNPVRFIDVDGMYADDPTITSVNKNGGVQTVSETAQSTQNGRAKNGVRTVTTTTTTASQDIVQKRRDGKLELGDATTTTSVNTATQTYDAESKSWVNNNDGKTTTTTVAGIDHKKFTNVGDAANTVKSFGIQDGNDYYSNIKQSGAFGMGAAAFGGTLPLTISGAQMPKNGLTERFGVDIGPGLATTIGQKMTANTPIIMAVGSYSQKVQNFNNTHPPAVRALQNALYKYTIGLFEPLFK